eukprot:28343_1
MNVARGYHGCVVHKNILYSIGGWNGYGLSSIETTNMTDANPSFRFSSMSLLDEMWSFGLILLEDDILIIGGTFGGAVHTDVQIIDTVSPSIRYGCNLNVAARDKTAIMMGNTLYAIGGRGVGNYLST